VVAAVVVPPEGDSDRLVVLPSEGGDGESEVEIGRVPGVVRSLGAGTLDLFEALPIAVELRELA